MEKILVECENNEIFITLLSDLVEEVSLELKKILKKHTDKGVKNITVDLGGVNQMATLGIGALVFAHRTLSQNNGRLELINASETVLKIFSSMTLDKVLHIR